MAKRLKVVPSSILLISLWSFLAQAEEGYRPTAIFVPGLTEGLISCGKYIASIEGTKIGKGKVISYPNGTTYYDVALLYHEWAKGYISAINMTSTKPINVDDFAAVQLWLRTYCMAHPTETYVNAVIFFVRDHK